MSTRDAIIRGERATIEPSEVEALKQREPALLLAVLKDGTTEGLHLAVELGFDVNAFDGYTPLHHAAAANDTETVQFLLDHGARTDVKDDEYDATPLGWAQFFDAPDAASLLGGT